MAKTTTTRRQEVADETTARDLRVMWKTVTVVAVIVAATISGIIYSVVWATRHDFRLETVEKWQATKDRQAAQELWQRRARP